MALINRMSRLFTADVHAVLDRIEEPDALLKQAIREMEEELARSEQRVRLLEHDRGTLADRHRKVQSALAELRDQLEVCFAGGNDELARKIIRRRLEAERLDKHVAERRAAADHELVEGRATIDAQREQLDVMRQKAELLAAGPTRRRRLGPHRVRRRRRRGRGGVSARASTEAAVMSKQPNSLSFGHALGSAFVLSLSGAAVLVTLSPFVGSGTALRAVIALLGLAYVLYVIGRSGERVGRITTVALWIAAASFAWFLGLPLVVYVLVHVGLVWLVRSLYHYSGVLPALADLGLGLLGAAFAVWAAQRSGSAWLALWCFFLVQSFHVLIPPTLGAAIAPPDAGNDAFARAHRAAEAAVRRLSSGH